MPKKLTTKEYFNLIRTNHKKYLEKNMVTHLEVTGNLAQAKLVEKYVGQIGDYRDNQSAYLNYAIAQPSTAATVGHGALAALLGIGVAGATYYAQNLTSPIDVINPLMGAKNIVGGVFSAAIGTGVSYLAYQAWLASTGRPANDDARKEFDAEMKKAGFTEAKYEELSKDLVKLFHYRECLLLGLKDNTDKNMREDFKNEHIPGNEIFNEKVFNAAIEVYFLDQLNKLFNKAFADIYNIQDDKIRQEKDQYKIITWLKSYFEKPEERQRFTQQLQIEFMDQCQNYLASQMVDPSFFAKYPFATSSITGLIAGGIALGLATAIIGGPITLGIAAIGLVITCLAAVGTYFAINNIESLKFKRGVENRSALQHAIDDIKSESKRLKRLIKEVVPTTAKELKQLEEYNAEGVPQGFLAYFNIFSTAKKQVAMGASTAWIREHAIRYRHSKQVEIDLSAQHQGIIDNGDAQTAEMQGLLLAEMRTENRGALPTAFKNFIDDTRTYLSNPDNQDFINRFELVEKIKQQVLEIVAVIPEKTNQTELPPELVAFYTRPVENGGLGGLEQDLKQVRSLARIVDPTEKADAQHPYHEMLIRAQRFNFALTRAKNEFILRGDSTYRKMIGLGGAPSKRIENKINAGNIQRYLNASYDFLYSLNKGFRIEGSFSDKPFDNTPEFILYRTLLLKQLASLADPSNPRVTDEVRREISKFAREKLHIDPKVVFDDILHQGLFLQKDDESPKLQDVALVGYPVSELRYIADAIRLDLAYVSKPITPRMMIAQEASDFLLGKSEKTMFSYEESKQTLQPDATTEYVEKIKDTIATTDEFITEMAKRNTLKKNGALASYIHDCKNEIEDLRSTINFRDQQRKLRDDPRFFNSLELAEAEKALDDFQKKLENILNIRSVEQLEQSNMMQSNIRFGEFAKPAINLDDWVEVIMEQPVDEEEATLIDVPLNFEESMIVIPESRPITDTKEKLSDFIDDINDYLAELDKEQEISFFNVINYSKKNRMEAATELRDSLVKLQGSENVSADFLNNKIYNIDKRLTGLISKNLVLMEIGDIHELFTPPSNLNLI